MEYRKNWVVAIAPFSKTCHYPDGDCPESGYTLEPELTPIEFLFETKEKMIEWLYDLSNKSIKMEID